MRNLTSVNYLNHTIVITIENDLANCEEHSHTYIELAYTVSGKAVHTLNGYDNIISSGDYVIINPGDVHNYKKMGNEKLTIINCIFTPVQQPSESNSIPFDSILHSLNIDIDSLTEEPTQYTFHDDDNKTVLNLLRIMENEYKKQNMKYKIIMKNLYDTIILHSVRSISSPPKNSLNITDYIKDYISVHYNEPNLLQTISNDTQYTMQYLSTRFKKETGRTFKNFLQHTRMNKACTLLVNTNMQIPQIAEAVGYSDIKYFINTFKKYKEHTPMKYRSMNISNPQKDS